MAEMKTDWSYPVMETTLDKRIERPGVQRGYSSEMTGVDGRSEGGLKPFPGYQLVHTMSQLKNQANHTYKSQVIDLKPVDFRIGSEHYGYGFVYRAVRPAAPAFADVFIDYWDSVNLTWTYCTMLMQGVSATKQFDVQVAGRFVYSFVEGRSPALFYIEASRTKEYACEADAFVNSAAATTNYESTQPLTLEIASGTPTKNAFLRFDTSAETGKVVESATLEVTVTGNTLSASGTLITAPITDPSSTSVLWNESQVTWNNRTTASAWSTAGGSYDATYQVSNTVGVGFLGRVSWDATTIVERAITGASQAFTRKTDVIVRGTTGTGLLLSLAGRTQPNYSIRPKLTVTYTNKVFLTPTVIGLTGSGTIPGPGMQPTLLSPERGIAPGSFTNLATGRPASAQVVLVDSDPYSAENLFPNEATGICYNDTVPAAGAVTQPGSPYTHSATGGACTDGVGILTQLLNPANRQTGVSVTPKLDWTSYYPSGTALNANVRWDVFLIEDGLGNIDNHCVVTGLTTTSYSPATLFPNQRLAYGKKYQWKVQVKRTDCTGFLYQSSVGTFTTEHRFQARKFEPGDYSFGYVLVNSKTGRKSAFSSVAQVRSEDFMAVRTEGGNTISTKQDHYIGIEVVYDSSKYDMMYVYRSVKIQDAGGTMIAGLPFLDAIIQLSDYHTCLNGTGRTFGDATTTRHAMYFYQLEDKQLVYQDPYVDRNVFDEKMPFGGTAMFHQNTMLVSKVEVPPASTTELDRTTDVVRGLGEMRWSSLMDMSPELFPPFNRYNPTVPSNEVVRFAKVGSNVIGLSRDKVYHIRKSGPYIKVTEMHEGYGIVNPKAVDSVGSSAYFVTSHGLKSVDMQGQLDEIRNINSVIVREWKNDLSSVQVAYDPYMNCLFVHNPVQFESYILWFSTGKTTKVKDANFDHCAQGSWPINWTSGLEASNELCRRAFFLQNNQENRPGTPSGYNSFAGPRVYVVDVNAVKTVQTGFPSLIGYRRLTTLDFDGDARLVATSTWDNINKSFQFSSANTTVGTDAWKFGYMYLVWSTQNPNDIGKKVRVMYNTSSLVYPEYTNATTSWITSVKVGDVFAVSPIVFEWAGHPIGLENEQGMVFSNADFFRMKVISSIGAAFSDVSDPYKNDAATAGAPMARFSGLVYSGVEEDPSRVALTKNTSGVLYSSVEDDEGMVYAAFGSDSSDGRYGVKGNSLTPGIRILCPDLDFRLLGCIVRGSITSVERSSHIRGS